MATTVPHILMTVHGGMPGGDSWTCGLRSWRTTAPLGSVGGNALALAVANRWALFRNSAIDLFGSQVGNCASIQGVTVRELDDFGLTAAQYEAAPTTAMTNPSTFPQTLPNQCAITVSLVTTRAGRTGKGRLYLPCLGLAAAGITGDRLNSAVVSAWVPFVKTLLDGVNTDLGANPGSGVKLAVQSPTAAKQWLDSNGAIADYDGAIITAFKIGDVIDTQRRRRSSLVENYQVAQVA